MASFFVVVVVAFTPKWTPERSIDFRRNTAPRYLAFDLLVPSDSMETRTKFRDWSNHYFFYVKVTIRK